MSIALIRLAIGCTSAFALLACTPVIADEKNKIDLLFPVKEKKIAVDGKPFSRLAQMAFDMGHKSCSLELDKHVKWVHEDDSSYAMHNAWNKTDPDKRTLISVTSVADANGSSQVTTFTSTLDATGKCSVSSIQSFPIGQSCTNFREISLKDWKYAGGIGPSAMLARNDGQKELLIYLNPMPNGCLVKKRYITYE